MNKTVCEYCGLSLSSKSLVTHIRRKHPEQIRYTVNENGQVTCKICGFTNMSKSGMGIHLKYHYGYCNKLAGQPSPLKGRTALNSISIKNRVEYLKSRYAKGEITPSFLGRTHSEATRIKWSNNPNMGGLREGSGRGIKGWYKGYYCRSTWEIAWLAYNLDSGKKVIQCEDFFIYEYEGKHHRYYPDFIMDGTYFEIKGYRNKYVEEKVRQFPKDKKLSMIEGKKEIKPFLDYAVEKYGKEFWKELYE